jgi:hypothetical protein
VKTQAQPQRAAPVVGVAEYDERVLAWLTVSMKQAAVGSEYEVFLNVISAEFLDLVRQAQEKAKEGPMQPQPAE